MPPDAGAAVAGLLRRHPLRRLCVRDGADALRTVPFFKHLDFDALALGAITPPIRPCLGLKKPAEYSNFDARFTSLPVETPPDDPANPDSPGSFAGDAAFARDWEFARS